MSVKKQFDWVNLSWQDFQKVCLHLAQNIFPDTNFEEYLRAGHKQAGIDILSVHQLTGKPITIQCKKTEKITESDAKEIIKAFEKGDFRGHSSQFILATSVHLDSKVIKYLQTEQQRLKDEYQVELKHWDRGFLEEQLRNHYNLVAKFFDIGTADDQCFAPVYLPANHQPSRVDDFIPRNVIRHRFGLTADQQRYYIHKSEITTLTEVITADRFKAKHICLIGDAHQGKSLLLRQTAWELHQLNFPFSPLFLECKYQTGQNIPEMLQENFRQWRQIPAKDILIFIDGMDEVPTDRFQDMLAYIRSFTQSLYPYVTVVFSCRRIFYEHYEIKNVLGHFDTYELYPLVDKGVDEYIKNKLPRKHEKFQKAVAGSGLSYFLFHPFFLTNLIESFNEEPAKFPTSKAQILEQFIEKSFDHQSSRKINGGMSLKDKITLYKGAVQRLALALQLSGMNSLTNEELQTILDTEEVELLKHNNLISKHNDHWSFTNALFQEHLAALMLMQMSHEQILSFLSVGKKIRKVKTKWIETTSSLLSLLDKNSPVYTELLTFVEHDNIELLFTTEKSKFDSDQRTMLLKKLINRCQARDIRPILVYEEKIARFVDGDEQSVRYLMTILFNDQTSFIVKVTASRILMNLTSLLGHGSSFHRKVRKALKTIKELTLACELIEVLSEFKLGDRSTAELLVNYSPFNQHHTYRSAVYQYLVTMGLVDEYYLFGLEGIGYLIKNNQKIHQGGSEHWFDQFLLATENISHLKQLIYQLGNQSWITYADRHSIHQEHLMRKVIQKAIKLNAVDPSITIAVTFLTRKLGRKYLKDQFSTIDEYFTETNSFDLAVRMSIKDLILDKGWGLSSLIRESSLDYLLWEWENHKSASMAVLRSWHGELKYKNILDADKVYSVLMDQTGGKLYEQQPATLDDYGTLDKQKRTNDLMYIQNQEAFKKGVEFFYSAYGKSDIPEEDIYVHFEGTQIRKKADSNFVYRFLACWINKNGVASLSKALRFIENNDNFERFRAQEIFQYNLNNTPNEQVLLDLIKDFFLKHLSTLKFANCRTDTTYRPLHVFIGEIFRKFQFKARASELMELVWTDSGGIRSFEHSELNNKQSLSQKILAHLSQEEQVAFAEKIISNLKKGIKNSQVLGNHLRLCKYLKIDDAVEIIYLLFTKNKSLSVSKADMLDIYLVLGGSLSTLLPYFRKMTDYNHDYFHFVKMFIDQFPHETHLSLKKGFSAQNISPDWKIKIAQHLCSLGDITGFEFLVDALRQNLKVPYSIQSFSKLSALNVEEALSLINDLRYLLFESDKAAHFSESPKKLMLEWLQIFALKSEDDLYRVIAFYEDCYQAFKDKYPNANSIFLHEELTIEKFRGSDKTVHSMEAVKQVIGSVDHRISLRAFP